LEDVKEVAYPVILVKTPNKAETKNPTNGSTGQGEKSPPTDVPYGVIAT
jgi:hypothetical protein